MKIATNIAGGLLGFLFIAFSLLVLLGFAPKSDLVPGTPKAEFFDAFASTRWLTLVKVCEFIGGILFAIPKTRNFGLLGWYRSSSISWRSIFWSRNAKASLEYPFSLPFSPCFFCGQSARHSPD